jgi:uncharacterized Tic20 family protein
MTEQHPPQGDQPPQQPAQQAQPGYEQFQQGGAQYQQQGYGYGQPAYPGSRPMSQNDEKTWATLAHAIPAIAMVVSAGTIGFIASLVIYLVVKDRGPFVRAHAANAFNVQLTALIGLIVSGLLMLVLVGFILYPLVVVACVVIHVIGAMKANNGEWWTPTFTIPYVK